MLQDSDGDRVLCKGLADAACGKMGEGERLELHEKERTGFCSSERYLYILLHEQQSPVGE